MRSRLVGGVLGLVVGIASLPSCKPERSSATPEQEITPSEREEMRSIIHSGLDGARDCNIAGQRQDSSLRGLVTVTITVGPDGFVSGAVLEESALADAGVEECILDSTKILVFPRSTTGAEFTFSIKFLPEDAARSGQPTRSVTADERGRP